MAYLPPDEELRRQQEQLTGAPSTGGGTPSGGGSSAGQAATATDTGSGWVNLQDYLMGNRETAQQMGQQLADRLAADAAKATSGTDAGPTVTTARHEAFRDVGPIGFTETMTEYPQVTDEQRELAGNTLEALDATGTQAGREALLDQYGNAGGLDAWLLAKAGLNPVKDVQEKWTAPLEAARDWQNKQTEVSREFDKPSPDRGPKKIGYQDDPRQRPEGLLPGGQEWTWDEKTGRWVKKDEGLLPGDQEVVWDEATGRWVKKNEQKPKRDPFNALLGR